MGDLERQVDEERRKCMDQVVALQRAERRCQQLEEAQRLSDEQCATAEKEVRALKDAAGKCNGEVHERAAMARAEVDTVRAEGRYETARLRGALDQLRYMIKRS